MNNILESVFRNLFVARNNIFPDMSVYSHFEAENSFSWTAGYQSDGIFGRIVYQKDGQTCYSDAIAVKISPKSFHFGSKPFQVRLGFINEITFYTKVVPLFDSFRPCTLFPKFYSSAIEANSFETRELIVFENLQSSDYVLSSRLSFLDLPHLRIMVRKLGEFHAYSLKALQTDAFDFHTAVKSMNNLRIDILKLEETSLLMATERGLKLLSNDDRYSEKATIIREKLNRVHDHVYNVLRGVTNHEDDILVLCHGDYLSTNVMFRYENNTPIDMKIIDMANCRLASPVVDLAPLLYLHASQQIRDDHWDELIDEYYASLKNSFPEIPIPSFEQLNREFRERALHAYYVASFFLGTLVARDDNSPQLLESIAEKYEFSRYDQIPPEVRAEFGYLRYGGEKTSEALVNILKDMIHRRFV